MLERGTYVGLSLIEPARSEIEDFAAQLRLPCPVPAAKRHTTLLYSRRHLPDFRPEPGLVHEGRALGFEVFAVAGAITSARCLVMLISAPTLEARFEQLMREHEATYDFPTYRPHITLSYNIGEWDITRLPVFQERILLGQEFTKDLDFSVKKMPTAEAGPTL